MCNILFSIINLSIGPIVSRTVGTIWGRENCKYYVDEYDDEKIGGIDEDRKKYYYQWRIDHCQRKKAMDDMEYTSFIFDEDYYIILASNQILFQKQV